MYKNKIKDWGLSKYLKADKAQQIVESATSANDAVLDRSPTIDHDEEVKRAQKSLKRKRARERTQSQVPPISAELHAEP